MSKGNDISHPDFALRMAQACDGNPHIPPLHYGRLGWFVKQFEEKNKSVTQETVRKWFSGESYPRKTAMSMLAQILAVDEAWLAVGRSPGMTEKQKKVRNATADGAVNVVAGFIQMEGGYPAFPGDDDKRAQAEKIDLYSIIKGAQYAFHIVLGVQTEQGWTFNIPVEALGTVILGVMPLCDLKCQFVELDAEGIETVGTRKGGVIEVVLGDGEPNWDWKQITTFSERL